MLGTLWLPAVPGVCLPCQPQPIENIPYIEGEFPLSYHDVLTDGARCKHWSSSPASSCCFPGAASQSQTFLPFTVIFTSRGIQLTSCLPAFKAFFFSFQEFNVFDSFPPLFLPWVHWEWLRKTGGFSDQPIHVTLFEINDWASGTSEAGLDNVIKMFLGWQL